jgi:hypothetical protein
VIRSHRTITELAGRSGPRGQEQENNMDVYSFQGMRPLARRRPHLLATAGLVAGILAASASGAAAARPSSCSGTFESPGTLAGTYTSNVTIEGACLVNAGPAVIEGNLTVSPGAVLLATFAEPSGLTVQGNLQVQRGAAVIVGCEPSPDAPCLDNETVGSKSSISGNLSEQQPLGVVVHNSAIGGNVQETGGGGGFTCANLGPTVGGFHVFGGAAFGGFPVYSDYSDTTVHGNLGVIGLNSCYLGVIREQVGGNVDLIHNQLADPDAIEVLSNQIAGNLLCEKNSMAWDSAEAVPGGATFPRIAMPNTVSGHRGGQCVISTPTEEGGPSGPGPF